MQARTRLIQSSTPSILAGLATLALAGGAHAQVGVYGVFGSETDQAHPLAVGLHSGTEATTIDVPLGSLSSVIGDVSLTAMTRGGQPARIPAGAALGYVHATPSGPVLKVSYTPGAGWQFVPPTAALTLQGPQQLLPLDLPQLDSQYVTGQAFPASGGEGTLVSIHEDMTAVVNAYDAEDGLFLGQGAGGFLGQVESLSADTVTGSIDHVSSFGQPTPVSLEFGNGDSTPLPPFQGVTYSSTYAWSGAPQNLTVVPTLATFQPSRRRLFEQCVQPDFCTYIRAVLENGELRFALPGDGTCQNDRMRIRLYYITQSGKRRYITTQTGTLPEAPWAIASLFTVYPFNVLLADLDAISDYLPSTKEVIISSPGDPIVNVHPLSHIKLTFDPATHEVFSQIAGQKDNYDTDGSASVCGDPDGSCASSNFAAYSAGILVPGQSRKHYDDAGLNQYVIETLDDFGTTFLNGPIRSAKFGTRIRGTASQTQTDSLHIGWNGNSGSIAEMDWGISLNDLDTQFDSDVQWSPGEDVFLCLDLSELPLTGSETRNILQRVQEDSLEVLLQDDTEVDFFEVQVLRCIQ